MFSLFRWWRERHPQPPAVVLVPDEVRKASHALGNAAQKARWHIRKAEESLLPIEQLIRKMRGEEEDRAERLKQQERGGSDYRP